MKKDYYEIIFFLLFFIGFSAASFSQATITFSKTSHDFGTILEGEIPSYKFSFENTGDEPLVLTNVKSSCGCTTPFWTKDPIPPGQSGIIKASFNSNKRIGDFTKGITVNSNASNAEVILSVKGEVVKNNGHTALEIRNSPKAIITPIFEDLKEIPIYKTANIPFTIKNVGPSILKINNVTSSCNCIGLGKENDYTVKNGYSKKFKFLYRPKKAGFADQTVTLHTNDLTRPEIDFVIRANVKQEKKVDFDIEKLIKSNN